MLKRPYPRRVRSFDCNLRRIVTYGRRMALDALPAEFIGTLTASTPGGRPTRCFSWPVRHQGRRHGHRRHLYWAEDYCVAASRSCCGRLGYHARRWRFLSRCSPLISYRGWRRHLCDVHRFCEAQRRRYEQHSHRTAHSKPATSVTHGSTVCSVLRLVPPLTRACDTRSTPSDIAMLMGYGRQHGTSIDYD